MNARPLVVIEKTAAIPVKDALKMVSSFTKAARDRMDNQGLDLTNRERESAVSQDVLEHLVMIQSALEDELSWLQDGRGSGKDSQASASPHKAANKASRSGKTENDKLQVVTSANKSSSSNEGKKRKFSDSDVSATAASKEADAPSQEEEEIGGKEEASSAKKDKKEKKEKKAKKIKVDDQ
jgi:hypothetical protein